MQENPDLNNSLEGSTHFCLLGLGLPTAGAEAGGREDKVEEIKSRRLWCGSAGFQWTLAFW